MAAKGYTVKATAKAAGVSPIALGKWLNHGVKPRLDTIGSILDNAEAIRKLSEFTGVVLVEERGKSRIDSIDAEILRAKSLGKDIIGIVLI